MSNIIIPNEKNSIIKGKDCKDFICMRDGTRMGDPKYCELSFKCRQVGVTPDGKMIGMKTDYTQVIDSKTGELKELDYLCTGMYVTDTNRRDDDEAS